MLFESKKEELNQKIEKAKPFKNKAKVITHYYKSSFSELRDQFKKKALKESWLEDNSPKNDAGENNEQYHHIHDHPDIKPLALTPKQKRTIEDFSSDSAKDVNNYLHKKDQDPDYFVRNKFIGPFIKTLSSTFKDKNNTNRKAMDVFSGVPRNVGETIMKSAKGSQHKFPAFTSTSTNASIASKFAHGYEENPKHVHIVAFHLEPHTGMSIVHHAAYEENEVLLPHGTIAHYSHTEEHTHPNGNKIFVHHMTVHSPK